MAREATLYCPSSWFITRGDLPPDHPELAGCAMWNGLEQSGNWPSARSCASFASGSGRFPSFSPRNSHHLRLDWLPIYGLLKELAMHQSAHSRHRVFGRRLPEPGVPLETPCEENRTIGLSNGESCDKSGSSGTNNLVATASDGREDAKGSSEAPNLEFDGALTADHPPLSEAATSTVAPSLFSETDVECPLCCRLLYTPITTRCGTLPLSSASCEPTRERHHKTLPLHASHSYFSVQNPLLPLF